MAKKSKIKTIDELYEYTENNPELDINDRVDLVDNHPILLEKIEELRELYNRMLNDAGVWRRSEEEIDKYTNHRAALKSEDPEESSIYDALWFNS